MYKDYLESKLAIIDISKISSGAYDPVICREVKSLLTFGNDISYNSWVDAPMPLDKLVNEFSGTSFKFVLNDHRLCMEATVTTSPSLSSRLHSIVSSRYDLTNYVPNKYDQMELIGANLVFVRLNLITTWIKNYAGKTFKVKPIAVRHRAIYDNSLHSCCMAVEVSAPELEEFVADFNNKFNLKTSLTFAFNIGRTSRTIFNGHGDSFDDTPHTTDTTTKSNTPPEKDKNNFTYNRRGRGRGRGKK
jgi:hypothetical protein